MLLELKDNLGSLTKALDVIYVLEGTKPVSRILYDEKNTQLLQFLKNNSLNHSLSDHKILVHIDNSRSYSDKGIRVPATDKRPGLRFMYISKKQKLAEEAKAAEDELDHIKLGKLLGYPDCCTKFFDEHHELAEMSTNDYTPFTFRKTQGIAFPWQNNFCIRGFDISLISHFPCNFKCKHSLEIANENLKVIERYDLDIARYFQSALRSALIYSEGIGVFSIKKYKIIGNRIEYSNDSVIPSNKNDFYNILKRRKYIRILNQNDFMIDDVRINDKNTFFGIFA